MENIDNVNDIVDILRPARSPQPHPILGSTLRYYKSAKYFLLSKQKQKSKSPF